DLVGPDVAPLLFVLGPHADAAGHGLAVAGEADLAELLAAGGQLRRLLADLLEILDGNEDVALERALHVGVEILRVLVAGPLDHEDDVDRPGRRRRRAALRFRIVALDPRLPDRGRHGGVAGEALEVDDGRPAQDVGSRRRRRTRIAAAGTRRRGRIAMRPARDRP